MTQSGHIDLAYLSITSSGVGMLDVGSWIFFEVVKVPGGKFGKGNQKESSHKPVSNHIESMKSTCSDVSWFPAQVLSSSSCHEMNGPLNKKLPTFCCGVALNFRCFPLLSMKE